MVNSKLIMRVNINFKNLQNIQIGTYLHPVKYSKYRIAVSKLRAHA